MARLALWIFIGVFAAACSAADPTSAPLTQNTDIPDPVVIETESTDISAEAAETTSDTIDYDAPQWASLELVDARTGETFTLADFAGKVVFVEPMATWCSNCRAQQRQVARALEQVNSDDVVFLSLSVENGMTPQRLNAYAESNDFPQRFAAASPELLDALVNQFGRTITNPPATPHFTIAPDGTVSMLSTGQHSSADVVNKVTALQGS